MGILSSLYKSYGMWRSQPEPSSPRLERCVCCQEGGQVWLRCTWDKKLFIRKWSITNFSVTQIIFTPLLLVKVTRATNTRKDVFQYPYCDVNFLAFLIKLFLFFRDETTYWTTLYICGIYQHTCTKERKDGEKEETVYCRTYWITAKCKNTLHSQVTTETKLKNKLYAEYSNRVRRKGTSICETWLLFVGLVILLSVPIISQV